MIRSGTADLPLHYGKVPEWLASRMAKLGLAVSEAVIAEYGTSGWISRMSDPFWFQALGCVMGMDWHSSGITTSVLGALKRAINPISRELGIHICGGRGRYSRQTPAELLEISDTFGTPGRQLAEASRLSAKVDNSCIQDGFQIYLHTFALSHDGQWAVVQQGMNKTSGMARRYHWHSANAGSFVDNPQTGIVGKNSGEIINFSDSRAGASRNAVVDFLNTNPTLQNKELLALGLVKPQPGKLQLDLWDVSEPSLVMPQHHDVRPADVSSSRLGAVLAAAYDKQFTSFTDALLLQGVGPRTVQSLALVSEVVYGKPNRFSDPARFSFAHGGKDGHPFPVPLHIYDNTISILEHAVKRAKIGNREQLESLQRLHTMSLEIESTQSLEADIEKVIRKERANSKLFGGKTVFS